MDSYLTSPIITVVVGRDEAQKTFFLHQDILEESSGFFKSGLHAWFQSGQTRTMDLADEDPRIFTLFANYVYGQNYDVESLGEDLERDMDAYILGEKYLAPGFSQAVFQQLIRQFELGQANTGKVLSVDKILEYAQKIYAETPTSDLLRQLIAKLAASMSGQPHQPRQPPALPYRGHIIYGPSINVESGSSPGSSSEEEGRKPVFSAEERMKLVQGAGVEFLCDVLGHSLAPRMSDFWGSKESKKLKELEELSKMSNPRNWGHYG